MIQMLNLYRCSSETHRLSETEIQYFAMDYFDGIKLENLSSEKVNLAECMGIKTGMNVDKQGISHQRYCLFTEEESTDIFQESPEFPLLTVIQVFLNPDIYQALKFEDQMDVVSCENCIQRVQQDLQKSFGSSEELRWQIFRLLTEGDFAVVVRSRNIHAAYDISTRIRSIRVSVNGEIKTNAFYSYSIAGIAEQTDLQAIVEWDKYLDPEDEVIIRMEYSPQFRMADKSEQDFKMAQSFLGYGHRLFGRYDYQMNLSSEEFRELYPYIKNFKAGRMKSSKEVLAEEKYGRVKSMLYMLQKGYISCVNERLLLKYKSDTVLNTTSGSTWPLAECVEWKSLYKRNEERIYEGKKDLLRLEETLHSYFQSGRNLQEYIRLFGRFYRVFYEMNQLQELRVSVANLLFQIERLRESIYVYLDIAVNEDWPRKALAECIEEYLRQGISAMEIFSRYARNVNLQTLQTPNYDLQTNVCVEKVLLAYSQFLKPFMKKKTYSEEEEQGYFLSNTLYPIVVPNMGVKDLSVCVLFDDAHGSEEEDHAKLMVVCSPTFAFLCETCFMLPTSFHEIAHQFRYEGRAVRNACLTDYILKQLILGILRQILDKEGMYRIQDEEFVWDIVDELCIFIKKKSGMEAEEECSLQQYRTRMITRLNRFASDVKSVAVTPEKVIYRYIEKTRNDVMSFDGELLKLLCNIKEKLEDLRKQFSEKSKDVEETAAYLLKALLQYRQLQFRQLASAMVELLNGENEPKLKEEKEHLSVFFSEGQEISSKDFYDLWKRLDKKIKLERGKAFKEIIKKVNHIDVIYAQSIKVFWPQKLEGGRENQQLLLEISKEAFPMINEKLWEFERKRENELDTEIIEITSEALEFIRKKVKLEKEDGIRKEVAAFLQRFQGSLEGLVDSTIDMYREITSDLFMCSIMGLNVWGYLILVAETFCFEDRTGEALYFRISAVIQCLMKTARGITLSREKYTRYLRELAQRELNVLAGEFSEFSKCKDITQDILLESGGKYIKDFMSYSELNSTQKWILRVYDQSIHIIQYLSGVYTVAEEKVWSKIWNDITGEASYLARQDKLLWTLEKNGGSELCKGIASILNSPASYFNSRKSLLREEVSFVLLNYEENCRSIFRDK